MPQQRSGESKAVRGLVLANDMLSDDCGSLLVSAGCETVTVGSVEEALSLLAATEFAVLVIDFRPDLLGHQAVCQLRMAQMELPVLFVSARFAADAVQRACDVGADDVAVLPLDPVTL